MSEQPDLFSPREPEATPTAAWTVSQFNERVKSLVKGAFGSFRIQGLVSAFDRSAARGGHVYFELQERENPDEAQAAAVVSMILWRGARTRLEGIIRELGGKLDDLPVTFQVSADLYVKSGRLSLIVEDIDLEASLGARRLDRERLMRKLAAEGLLDRNRSRPLPLVPLRVGLITSLESAAYHDFIQELGLYGFAFRVRALDARMQGAEAESTVPAALSVLGRPAAELDLIVLIRGGGSRSDLSAFDSEAIARAIAACPLPVLTGIGHEIDRSVADELAHRAFKTPTAVAQFLAEQVEDFQESLLARGRQIRMAAELRLRETRGGLDGRRHRFQTRVERRLARAREALARRRALFPRLARGALEREGLRLKARQGRLSPRRLRGDLLRRRRQLAERYGGMERRALRLLRESRRALDHRDERLKLLDPARVLTRGFSITTGPDGRALRSVRGLAPGAPIRTRLADGRVDSTIRNVEEDKPA